MEKNARIYVAGHRGLVGSAIVRNDEKPKVMLWGTGSPKREFLHVDDLADASLFLMRNYDDEEIVNVGVGEDIAIKELAELVQEIVRFEGDVVWDSDKPDGTPRKLMDVSKLTELGWQAGTSFQNGIVQTYKWYQEHQQ